MALYKHIVLSSGVEVVYHRVVSLNQITNVETVIEIAGYTSREKRQEEQHGFETGYQEPIDVFIDTRYISAPYSSVTTVDEAYEYLKTLPQYTGAEDI
jgi:hypothetical protein